MLGFLLARAGVEVLVLEKHADFLRDFRGDTVHPSTLEIMHELGLLDDFLKRPHQEARQITGYIGDEKIPIADFTHLKSACPFVALMPQWDFLNFLAQKAQLYPSFHLMMQANVTQLTKEKGRIVGVRAETLDGPLAVRAELVIGADGRHSTVRRLADLVPLSLGVPIDVLWMRLARRPTDPSQPLGRFSRGQILIMIDRGDYWQCALVIAKGAFGRIRQDGLAKFRATIANAAPFVRDRVDELSRWDDVKLLTVTVDRLRRWYRCGVLCIGDSAHAMSPVGGVGINLAIQDAVATANLLAVPLLTGKLTTADLARVQRRRELPTRIIQRLQIFVQNRVLNPVLASRSDLAVPRIARLLQRYPVLRRIPARIIGVGIRPEHVRSPESTGASA